ncbi:hypothetical protein [Primorskyibacter sp. S187A]|uniref:hypothetical protein n=1 Tax=Primorskyibacter sp. S187A TaxID=3415130 RepID=UPI003C7E23EE
MDASLKFDKRVRTIAKKNRRIARGHTTYIDAMGVIRKRPSRGIVSNIPFKGIIYLFLGFSIFKAVALASAGSATYAARLGLLESGTLFERAGAWVLQIDPVTRFLAGIFAPIF